MTMKRDLATILGDARWAPPSSVAWKFSPVILVEESVEGEVFGSIRPFATPACGLDTDFCGERHDEGRGARRDSPDDSLPHPGEHAPDGGGAGLEAARGHRRPVQGRGRVEVP